MDVLQCNDCGHVFSSYRNDKDYNRYFGTKLIDSEEQFWWNEAHKAPYDSFCDMFLADRSGRLLDVGCGLGYFVRRVADVPGWEAFGYEISQPAVDFARRKLGLDTVSLGRVEDAQFERESFDIITLWDVIEHIPDPDPLLAYLFSTLKHAGILFIHTPNVQVQLPKARLKRWIWGMKPGVHYLEARDHLHIYSMKTISIILRRSGFAEINFIHLPPIQSVAGSRNSLLMFAKNAWFYFAAGLLATSRGRVNLDNLFVIARKGAH